jgi:hypothetical protein
MDRLESTAKRSPGREFVTFEAWSFWPSHPTTMSRSDALPNLILGCGTDYSFDQILPFAATLRNSGFSGETALVVYEDQGNSLHRLVKDYSLSLIQIPRKPVWLPGFIAKRIQNRGSVRHAHNALAELLPRYCKHASFLNYCSQTLHYLYHISCGRYFVYFRYLYKNSGRFARVLLTDVRDVMFQSNPFHYATYPGLFAFKDPIVCLGDEPLNVRWIKNLFGEEYCQSLRGQRIFCSGTTLGDALSIVAYLHKMCLILIQALPRLVGQIGDDQAAHNYLLWERRIPNVIICENGENAVMTLKNALSESLVLDKNGQLLNFDGSPAPVLHQYDFHPIFKSSKTT